MSGLAVVALLLACAAAAPWLAPYAPEAQDLARRLARPGPDHWLGTDALGRDIASRLIHGSRTTLEIAFLVPLIAAPAGLVLGCVAGYAGGLADLVLMRLTDIVLAFPRLVLALALAAALGPGLENAAFAIAATSWPAYARVARAETLRLRRADFIAAARLAGASPPRVVFLHAMPLCLDSVVVRVGLDMAGIVLAAAGLGFSRPGRAAPRRGMGRDESPRGANISSTAGGSPSAPAPPSSSSAWGSTCWATGLRDLLDPACDDGRH